MEENNNIFLAGGDALVYFSVLERTYLRTNFSAPLSLVSICTHLEYLFLP